MLGQGFMGLVVSGRTDLEVLAALDGVHVRVFAGVASEAEHDLLRGLGLRRAAVLLNCRV